MRDIILIGSGLAGAGLATALATLGHDVLLIERDHLPRHKVCGEFLSPDSQATLHALGLRAAVAALGPAPMERARLVGRSGGALEVELPGIAWGVSRYRLDAALAEAARQAGASVLTGLTATGLNCEDAGVTVELRTPEGPRLERARSAVVACGRNPLPGLRIDEPPHSRPTFVGVKGHYTGVTMPAQVEIYLFDGGYAGLGPIEGGRVNMCLLVTREAFQRAGAGTREMLEAAVRSSPTLAKRLAGAELVDESLCAVAPVDTHRPATPWHQVARIGDAATMIPPLCGDGMAMALRAAEICAPLAHAFLRSQINLQVWQQRYQAAWQAEFEGPVRTGRSLQSLLMTPYLADGLLLAGNLLPTIAQRLVHATRGRVRPLPTG